MVVLAISAVVFIFSAIAYLVGNIANQVGYSPNTSIRRIIIGNDVVDIPGNVIRFARQRDVATLNRVDLYYLWPSFEGFSESKRDAFLAHSTPAQNLIFASLENRKMRDDMSGRFKTIYSKLLENGPIASEAGLVFQNLAPKSGYSGEELHYERGGGTPYVVRCQRVDEHTTTPTCLRDVNIGKGLSLSYRFSRKLLPRWRALENTLRNITASYLAQ